VDLGLGRQQCRRDADEQPDDREHGNGAAIAAPVPVVGGGLSCGIAKAVLTVILGHAGQRAGCVRKSSLNSTRQLTLAMDIERINQIGTSLADLTARTEALRGYL
jgi:hypothetical protein